jgi:hypothetical protein
MNNRIFIKLIVLFSLAAIGFAGLLWVCWSWIGVRMNGIHESGLGQFYACVTLGVLIMYLLTDSMMADMEEEERDTIHETFEEIREELTTAMEADGRYREMLRLEVMLENAGIPFQKERCFNGWVMKYPAWEDCRISVAEHVGSYGSMTDSLEIWEMEKEEPEGWMTAEEVLLRITNDWVKHGKM